MMLKQPSSNLKLWSAPCTHTELLKQQQEETIKKTSTPDAGKRCYAILHLFFIGFWDRLVVVAVYVNLLLQSL
jgi:hypothetical protein